MRYVRPNEDDFKAFFFRDFPYGTDMELHVLDADISKAIMQAGVNFNDDLFSSQESFRMCFLYLVAHYLIVDLRAAAGGISGNSTWLSSSRSVGSVSESVALPSFISEDPYFSTIATTQYGTKYISMILPQIRGQVFSTPGGTNA